MNKNSEFVNNFFGSIYLTIIALLQGVAIYQLTPYLVSYCTTDGTRIHDIYTVPLFITLMVIFVVWHHYVNGILYLRWFPNIIDAIIPFAISIAEFILISFLEKKGEPAVMNMHAWMQSFIFFLVTGSIAYFAAAIRNDSRLFTNFINRETAKIHGRNLRRFYIQAGISMTLQALFSIFVLIAHREWLLWFSLFFFILHIVISEYLHIHNILPLFKKGLSDFRAGEN